MPLSRQARIASALLPSRLHFRFALAASRWQGRLIARWGGNGALTEALMRDHWLRELTVHGPFPIPMRVHGLEVMDTYSVPGPVLYCATHLPLGEIPLRVPMEFGYPVPIPVADRGRVLKQERYLVAGMAERIPALPVSPYVLARMRTLLLRGQPVVCLADGEFGGELSANPLRLAARLRVPVIFSWAELAPDRVIDVTFRLAPHPLCETEEAIAENVAFLQEITERVLRSLGVGSRCVTSGRETSESEPVSAHPKARRIHP
jgi:hypothetical protein